MKRLIFALVLLSSPAFAAFNNGNTFLAKCEATPNEPYCLGYVAGLVDAVSDQICIPKGTTSRQIFDTLLMFIQENPDVRQRNMGRVLQEALRERPLC